MIQKALANRQLRPYKADLADFSALKRALDEIKSREEKIDVLFNNAGGSFPELVYSKQGREMHFELQTVVPYIIFMELKDLLKQGSFKTIVNTSSSALKMVRRFEPAELARSGRSRSCSVPTPLPSWRCRCGPAKLLLWQPLKA